MRMRKSNILSNPSSIRHRFKIFRIIISLIFLLIFVLLLIACFGSMEDAVKGDGTVVGIREYDLKTLVSAKIIQVLSF